MVEGWMFPDLGMCQSAMMVRTSVSALEYEPAASARGYMVSWPRTYRPPTETQPFPEA